jgi:hypothetical protein
VTLWAMPALIFNPRWGTLSSLHSAKSILPMRNRQTQIASPFTSLFLLVVFLLPAILRANDEPRLPDVERTLLAEAFRINETLGDQVWSGWSKAPFAVLLVTPEYEFLVRHPRPSGDFTSLGYDSLLRSDVLYRKRVFAPNLLATFPAVNGLPTIVIGEPQNTAAKTPTRWLVTLLHEHFHQLQMSQPDYYADVDSLGLARGDKTGMWMLNFPFPYDSAEVQRQFLLLCQSLSNALHASGETDLRARVKTYLQRKEAFRKMLMPDEYKYFSFQLWQEGVARYTEYRVGALAGKAFRPSRQFRSLRNVSTFRQDADSLREQILTQLPHLSLGELHRVAFYTVGAAEAMLLDRARPGWQQDYFAEKFQTDKYFGE